MKHYTPGKFDVYQAKDGWRWRIKSINGHITCESGEAYTSVRDACRGFISMKNTMFYGYEQAHQAMQAHGYDYDYDVERDRYVVVRYDRPKP